LQSFKLNTKAIRAMKNDGTMSVKVVYVLTFIGLIGSAAALFML
jgi:hypothetical protein